MSKTIKEVLQQWKNGEPVETIEMGGLGGLGGLGDEYERAIHSAVFGILEAMHETFYRQVGKQMDDIVATLPDQGWSGAQIVAAKQVAFKALCYGWEGMMKTVPEDRKIFVSRS